MYFLLLFIYFPLVSSRYDLLRITNGLLQGKRFDDLNATAFLNIPYAVPPVGDRRFTNVGMFHKKWSQIRNASSYGPACMSNTSFTGSPQTIMSENCLSINVFISDQCRNVEIYPYGCPAIYYIHGGMFLYDSPRIYEPKTILRNFASRNVIFITVAYRLNAFGSFWLPGAEHREDVNGNYHLNDIVIGLAWVNREIYNLNINRNKITIMGHSSGGITASLLSHIKIIDDKYNNIIAMSGTIENVTIQVNTSMEESFDVAVKLSCAFESERKQLNYGFSKLRRQAIINCMRNISAGALSRAQREMEQDAEHNVAPSLPHIDGYLFSNNIASLRKQRTPRNYMAGTVKKELFFGPLNGTKAENYRQVKRSCEMQIAYNSIEQSMAIDYCANHYLSKYKFEANEQVRSDYFYVSAFNDVNAMAQTIRDHNWNGHVYLYQFDYDLNPSGTHHAADMSFVLGLHADRYNFTKDDIKMREIYLNYFTNFVKNNNPSDHWRPFNKSNYLSINSRSVNRLSYHGEAVNFFNHVLPAYIYGIEYERHLLTHY